MANSGVPIPDLDPAWPDELTIAVVTSGGSPRGWLRLAHQVTAVVQPGVTLFRWQPIPRGSRGDDPGRKAFLYRQEGRVCGYVALADKTVTGYREPSARYREADSLERVGRPCVLVV
jgi:hypothetical protein